MKIIKWLIFVSLILVAISAILWILNNRKTTIIPIKVIKQNIMILTSSAFENGQRIPLEFTCDGSGVNPPLSIDKVPENANSLVLIVDDPDAPGGNFVHWLVWNIGPKVNLIDKNSVPVNSVRGKNDFGENNYGAPCPPSGSHRYQYKVYALDKAIDISSSSGKSDLEKAMEGHILDQSILTGMYSRN